LALVSRLPEGFELTIATNSIDIAGTALGVLIRASLLIADRPA
jgi:hypothetical protein